MNLASVFITLVIAVLFIVALRYAIKSRGCPSCNHGTGGSCKHCQDTFCCQPADDRADTHKKA